MSPLCLAPSELRRQTEPVLHRIGRASPPMAEDANQAKGRLRPSRTADGNRAPPGFVLPLLPPGAGSRGSTHDSWTVPNKRQRASSDGADLRHLENPQVRA